MPVESKCVGKYRGVPVHMPLDVSSNLQCIVSAKSRVNIGRHITKQSVVCDLINREYRSLIGAGLLPDYDKLHNTN